MALMLPVAPIATGFDLVERPPLLVRAKRAKLWLRGWRLFYQAIEGVFGYADDVDRDVTHHHLAPSRS